jgi:hypothetical protein
MQWFNSSNGKSYLYYSNAWIEVDSNGNSASSNGNSVINGAFDIWQRGTSFAVPSANNAFYTADRWSVYRAATGSTVSRQPTNDTINLPNIQHGIRIQRDSGNTVTGGVSIIQHFETANSIPFAGKQVTLSFYARKGADYSNATSSIDINLATGTGVDQNVWVGLTGRANPINVSRTVTSTWTRFTATGTIAANVTQLLLNIFVSSFAGTAGANDWIEITGVQLEEGTVATPFRRNAPSIQAELAACQRYYVRCTGNQVLSPGFARISTIFTSVFSLPVEMRTTPTIETNTSTSVNYVAVETGDQDFGSLAISKTLGANSGTRAVGINASNPGATMIVGRGGVLRLQDSLAFVGFVAEL